MRLIIVALKCEANPLIQHYGLKRLQGDKVFPVYGKDDIYLTVSGPGKIASAAATAFSRTLPDMQKNSAWLNLGIAGHKDRPVGQGLIASKISDASSGKNWYPPLVFDPPAELETLITVDNVEESFNTDAIYEMEASGYYETASRFSTAELIHCYKVISDNKQSTTKDISAKTVSGLVENRMADIDVLMTELYTLAEILRELESHPALYDEINERWHFSVYQQGQLQQLLKRWETISRTESSELKSLMADLDQCSSSRGVLKNIEQKLGSSVMRL